MRVKKLKRVLEQQEAEEDMVESSWVGLVFSAVGWCVLEIFVWEVGWTVVLDEPNFFFFFFNIFLY